MWLLYDNSKLRLEYDVNSFTFSIGLYIETFYKIIYLNHLFIVVCLTYESRLWQLYV